MRGNRRIDVDISYLENLSQVNFDILALDGKPLSGQDIIEAVAETLLLKWDLYDLEATKPEDYDA